MQFVVLGDIPYGQHQLVRLAAIGKEIRKGSFLFVIHYGDVKAGSSRCDDALLSERRDAIYDLLKGRVFFTPGDNDWTDCDRGSAGGFDELERLKAIRSIFFSKGLPSDSQWRVERQGPDYPENARWEYGGLQFLTLHIVGTDNGRRDISKSDVQTALNAVDARDQANLAWLDAAFDQARQRNLEGLVLIMHADPGESVYRQHRNQPCGTQRRTQCNPYLQFLRRLTERADDFDKPVLLVHGSTMNYCLDRGFGGWRAPKLWRLNGPGDYAVIDATVISFEPDAVDGAPFKMRSLLTDDSVASCSLQ